MRRHNCARKKTSLRALSIARRRAYRPEPRDDCFLRALFANQNLHITRTQFANLPLMFAEPTVIVAVSSAATAATPDWMKYRSLACALSRSCRRIARHGSAETGIFGRIQQLRDRLGIQMLGNPLVG